MEAQQELRFQVVRMRREGMNNREAARLVGLSEATTSTIWSKYQREGKKGILLKKRGRKEGEKKRLGAKEEAQIIQRLLDTTPEQLKFRFAL